LAQSRARRGRGSAPQPTLTLAAMPRREKKAGKEKSLQQIEEEDTEEAIDQIGLGMFHWEVYLIVGLFTAADSVEIGFISFVTEVLKQEWGLEESAKATMEAMIFVGMLLGAPTWGWLADKYGRRPIMLISAMVVSIFGFLTAACNSAGQLIPCRLMVGFGCSGCVVAFDVFAELLPTDYRGPLTMSTFYWFTLGALYSNVCAKFLLCSMGWRTFTIVCALPTFVAAAAGFFLVPESAHWLVAEGRKKEAAEVLNGIAKRNGSPMRYSSLTMPEVLEEVGTMDLCTRSKLRRPLIFMMFTWVGWGLAYYGIALLLPHLFSEHKELAKETQLPNMTTGATSVSQFINATAGATSALSGIPNVTAGVLSLSEVVETATSVSQKCYGLSFNFKDIIISNAGQACGLTVGVILVNRIGRKKTQAFLYFVAAVFAIGLGFPNWEKDILTIFSAVSLAAVNGASSCTWSHTPELFPTHARVLATGICSAAARLGAASSPYVISDLIPPFPTAMIMSSFSFMAMVTILFVKETAGHKIEDDDIESSDDEASEVSDMSDGDFNLNPRDIDME